MLACIQRSRNACGSDRSDNGWPEGKADGLQIARRRTDNCREWLCSFATSLVMVMRGNNGAVTRAKTFLGAPALSAFERRDYAAAHSSLTNRVNAAQRGRLHRRLD